MPSVAAAVAAFHNWPAVPEGWERHMTKAGDEYPTSAAAVDSSEAADDSPDDGPAR